MPISQLIANVRARWKLVASVFGAVVLASLLASLLTPRSYLATASVVIDIKSQDPVAGVGLQGMTAQNYMATQTDVLNSARVAEKVVKGLHGSDLKEVQARWTAAGEKGAFDEWATIYLRKGLTVLPSRESNVINIAYKAPTPQMAMNMANAFVESFVETAIDLRVQPAQQYSQFFDKQAARARDRLEEAQGRLAKFQQSKGIVVTDERLDVENARLTELSREVVILQSQAAESGSRQAQAAIQGDRMQEMVNNPAINALRADLGAAQISLREARQRYGENHPKIIELRGTVSELESRLRAETSRLAGSVTASNAVNQGRLTQLSKLLEEQRAKVLAMTAARAEAGVLMRDVESAQRAYDVVQNRLNQTSLESQSAQGNIAPLELAKLPRDQASPKPLLNLAVGIFAGALLGILAAVLREMFDRRLRTVDAVTEIIQRPLLCTIPVFSKDAALGFNSQRALAGPKNTKRIKAA